MNARDLSLGLLLCILVGSAIAGFSDAMPARASGTDITEFTFSQVQLVETLQCPSYDVLIDITQTGHVTATGCTASGLLIPGVFKGGHVTVDVTLTDGTHYVMTGCRGGSTAVPTYLHYSLICVP
jgi:hypothetical protein